MANYHNIHIDNVDLQTIADMGMVPVMLDAINKERDTTIETREGSKIVVSFDGLNPDGTAPDNTIVDVYVTDSKSEKLNESITTKDPKFKEALKTVLIGLANEDNNAEYLRKYKNIENPTDDQIAMWQAYGIFNALQDISQDIDMADSLALAIDDYIDENGGWDFIPNDD